MILKKTLSKSRLSPDTLDTVKMGVMLSGKSQAHNEAIQSTLAIFNPLLFSMTEGTHATAKHYASHWHTFYYVHAFLTWVTGQTVVLL